MAGANALGYLLNLVASRVLGPTAFGALGALLGLVLIGNVVALGLQTVTARVLASSPGDGGRSAGDLYRLGRWSAAAVTGLAFAAAPVVAHLLHLRDGWSAWVLPLVLGSLTITGVQLGLLQGGERFRRLAGLYLLAAAGKVGGGPWVWPSGAPSPPRWPGPRPGRWSARRRATCSSATSSSRRRAARSPAICPSCCGPRTRWSCCSC